MGIKYNQERRRRTDNSRFVILGFIGLGLLVASLSLFNSETEQAINQPPITTTGHQEAPPAIPQIDSGSRPVVTEASSPTESVVESTKDKSTTEDEIPTTPKYVYPLSKLEAVDETGVVLKAGFDCSPKNVEVSVKENSHFSVKFPRGGRSAVGFFLFRLENAAGKQITIDLTNVPEKWRTLNPVICNDADLSRLENFASYLDEDPSEPQKASNGPLLPDTQGEQWYFVPNVVYDKSIKTLTFKHEFESDAVSISMRPPYTPAYNENYVESLKNREGVIVHTVGTTYQDNDLHVIQIGGEDEKSRYRNPTILIHAREHADEHDGSWVAQGAIEYLLQEDHRTARKLRSRINLLVIPIVDVDGANSCEYHRIVDSFYPRRGTPESRAYCGFFKQWYDQKGHIDFTVNLHNVESAEAPHFSCGSIANHTLHGLWARQFHEYAYSHFQAWGFDAPRRIWGPDNYHYRMDGYLQQRFGTTRILYEANSQAPKRHLSLAQLRMMGAMLLEATGEYLLSRSARPLLAFSKERQKHRMRNWLYWRPDLSTKGFHDVMEAEMHIPAWSKPEELKNRHGYQGHYADFLERLRDFPQFRIAGEL